MKVANAEAETNIKHATTLNDLLENSNEAIQSLSTIGGILGNTKQLLVVVAGLLFLAGAWMIYRKFAGFLIAGSGKYFLLLFNAYQVTQFNRSCHSVIPLRNSEMAQIHTRMRLYPPHDDHGPQAQGLDSSMSLGIWAALLRSLLVRPLHLSLQIQERCYPKRRGAQHAGNLTVFHKALQEQVQQQ